MHALDVHDNLHVRMHLVQVKKKFKVCTGHTGTRNEICTDARDQSFHCSEACAIEAESLRFIFSALIPDQRLLLWVAFFLLSFFLAVCVFLYL